MKKKVTKKAFEEDLKRGLTAGSGWIDEGNRYGNYHAIAQGQCLQLTLDGWMGFLKKVKTAFLKRHEAYHNEKDFRIFKTAVSTLTYMEDNEDFLRLMNTPLFTKEEEEEMNMSPNQLAKKALDELRKA